MEKRLIFFVMLAMLIFSSSLAFAKYSLFLSRGETRNVDLNSDGKEEVSVKFIDFSDNKASLEVDSIGGNICGNRVCEKGETSSSCCTDCGCSLGEECKSSICVVTNKSTNTKISLLLIGSLIGLIIVGLVVFRFYAGSGWA